MEGGKSREEVTRDRETLREEEKGGKDRGKTEARKPPNAFFSVFVSAFGMGDFGKYKKA